ncbi:conserved within P. aerophilum [Pyrobaculum aerophilum str. IM2]|uniref:Conserved within P. aerophilum n=1 Tax=Pyrobaculum aerophilum (strain ATCC 51768 / DSM 7523 / JCM 9630 / CIP 104966 / NBRC 100827 / IM2) TaxID=178306 RepID=Q8ZX69_PYRAE|nr:conserved within P. aerophilum [Pyrobaculum aerophilum str. IM2]
MDLVEFILTTGAFFVWQAIFLYVYKELYSPKLPMRLFLPVVFLLSALFGFLMNIQP